MVPKRIGLSLASVIFNLRMVVPTLRPVLYGMINTKSAVESPSNSQTKTSTFNYRISINICDKPATRICYDRKNFKRITSTTRQLTVQQHQQRAHHHLSPSKRMRTKTDRLTQWMILMVGQSDRRTRTKQIVDPPRLIHKTKREFELAFPSLFLSIIP